jgi:hypothetical protein
MALTEETTVEIGRITSDGQVHVKQITSTGIHRHVVRPGDPLSKEVQTVKDICGDIHTAEVIKQFQAAN